MRLFGGPVKRKVGGRASGGRHPLRRRRHGRRPDVRRDAATTRQPARHPAGRITSIPRPLTLLPPWYPTRYIFGLRFSDAFVRLRVPHPSQHLSTGARQHLKRKGVPSPHQVRARLSGMSLADSKVTNPGRRPLPDKGTPVARRGRKATGQAVSLIAGLPKEGRRNAPREHGGLPRQGGQSCLGEPPFPVTPSSAPPQPATHNGSTLGPPPLKSAALPARHELRRTARDPRLGLRLFNEPTGWRGRFTARSLSHASLSG
jgi:hypothetical protein